MRVITVYIFHAAHLTELLVLSGIKDLKEKLEILESTLERLKEKVRYLPMFLDDVSRAIIYP